MDEIEVDCINRNLTDLIASTRCNEVFLSYFVKDGVLSGEDLDDIKSKSGETAKAAIFYEIVKQRRHGYQCLLRALEETVQSGAWMKLVSFQNQKATKTKFGVSDEGSHTLLNAFMFHVRAPAPLFTGRNRDLQNLHKKLSAFNNPGGSVNVVALSGLGGIGKTELVRKYIQGQYPGYYEFVIWINGEPDSIKESFRTLAKDKLNISTTDANKGEKDITTIVSEVYRHFTKRRSLFVFDNAEKSNYLSDYLPRNYITDKTDVGSGYIKVVLTTRNSNWAQEEAYELTLKELGPDDAIEFVRKGLEITSYEDIHEITGLVKKLQCFPLALQQAIAYIREENKLDPDGYTIVSFLEDFQNQSMQILDYLPSLINLDYNKTTYATWKMTLEKIGKQEPYGDLAVRIINCMAYMSDNFDRSSFNSISANKREIGKAVGLLQSYSMITSDMKPNSKLRIHRLVQEVIQKNLQIDNKEEDILEYVLEILKFTPFNGNLDHAISAWSHASAHTNLVKKFSKFPSEVTEGLIGHGRFREALEFAQRNKDKIRIELGEAGVLDLSHQIGVASYRLGNYNEAMTILEDVLENRKHVCGEMNPDTLDTIHFIASLKLEQGKPEVAREMYRDVFEKKQQVLGLQKEKTIDSLLNEGICLLEMSQYTEALECYNKAYLLYVNILGEDSEAALITKQNIAVLIGDMGKLKEAIKTLRSLQSSENQKKDILRQLIVNQNLAFYLALDGQLDEAYELSKSTLMELARLIGDDHPHTLMTKTNLGIIQRKMHRFDEALKTQHEVYKKHLSIFGKDTDKTLLVKAEIGIIWGWQKLYDDSVSALKEIIRLLESKRETKHHNVIRIKIELASILESQGNKNEALQILVDVKQVILDTLGEEHAELPKISESILRLTKN